MNKFIATIVFSVIATVTVAQTYNGPESVEFDPTGNRYFVSNNSSGQILARDASGTLSVFATGISPNPYGLEMLWGNLYACCSGYIKGWDMTGTQILNLNLGATFLNGITHDNSGNLYATDFSAKKIYRINVTNNTYNVFVPSSQLTASPNGIIWDQGNNRLVLVSWGPNVKIKAISLADSSVTDLITTSLSSCDGIAEDGAGNFYISNWGANSVVKYNNSFTNTPTTVMTGLHSPADIFYNIFSDTLAVPNSSTSSNTVVFQSFAPATNLTICNDVPLTLFTDSTTWGASDGMVSGTDSMIHCVLKNTSNYSFAYTEVKFNFIDPLPTGVTVDAGSQGLIVIASAWNPGVTVPAKCYFHVSTPIPDGYQMRFTMSVTNLPPANVDTCMFSDTFSFFMHMPNSICDCEYFPSFNIYPNPATNELSINYSGADGDKIEIADLLGRKWKEIKLNSTTKKISLTEIPAGVYFLSLYNADERKLTVKKFVKQ